MSEENKINEDPKNNDPGTVDPGNNGNDSGKPPTKYKTRLLSDDPVWDDAFASDGDIGPHERVAQAIAELIRDDPEGKAIALNGGWGSGKSSVVKMVDKELGNTVHVFEFDAWAHKGDNLRRAFLDQLIEKVVLYKKPCREHEPNNIRNKWCGEKDKLGKQVVETKSKTKPTPYGIAIAFAVLVSGYFIASISKHGFDIDNTLFRLIAIFGAFYPVFVSFIFYLYDLNRSKPKNHDKTDLVWFSLSESETDSATISYPVPSSIEFESTYFDALKQILEKNTKKLVIVIDNLDRIEAKESMEIWATMRSFFEIRNKWEFCDKLKAQKDRDCKVIYCTEIQRSRNNCWLKRLWMLVPFDYEAINGMWKKVSLNEEKPQNNRESIAQSFAKKTFQLTFNVPVPVITKANDYILKKLRIAFPNPKNFSDDELKATATIFRLRGRPSKRNLTPRDVIIFINQLVALYRQWGNEIPLRQQAFYVTLLLKSQHMENLLRNASDSEILGSIPEFLIQPTDSASKWRKALIALYFNVPAEKAIEVLLWPEFQKALELGRFTGNEAIFNYDNSYLVLQEVVNELYASGVYKDLSKIALTENAVRSDIALEKLIIPESVDKILNNALMAAVECSVINDQTSQGIENFIKLYKGEKKVVLSIIDKVSRTNPIDNTLPPDEQKIRILSWFDGINKILYAAASQIGESIKQEFRLNIDEKDYIVILSEIARLESVAIPHVTNLRPSNPERILDKFKSLFLDDNISSTDTQTIDLLTMITPPFKWEILVSFFSEEIGENLISKSQVSESIIQLLVLREFYPNARLALMAITKHKKILGIIDSLDRESYTDARVYAALLISICIYHDRFITSKYANPDKKRWQQKLLKVMDEIDSIPSIQREIKNIRRLANLKKLLNDFPKTPLISEFIDKISYSAPPNTP